MSWKGIGKKKWKFEKEFTGEGSSYITNPSRGWYEIYTFQAEEKAALEELKWSLHEGETLALVLVDIGSFRERPLDPAALENIRKILDFFEENQRDVIFRPVYDREGKGRGREPGSFELVLEHLGQLGDLLKENPCSVFIFQGFLVGSWGEMHDSAYLSEDCLKKMWEQLKPALSKNIYGAVRTPAQLRGILRTKTPLASSQTGDGSLASRLGLFNDGMLGSVYDLGTYDDTPLTSSSTPGEKGSRSDELIYQYKLCQYVPNGGEVTVDNEYNDLENAIADLATMHVSYLNAEHDPEVLSKWKNSVYTGSDIFSGVNGFDYMSAHLGYRYRLKTSSLAFRSLLDDTARLYLTIENTGFSSAYRTFETTLVLKNENTGESEDLETNIDNTSIAGNDESIFRLELDVRSLKKGTYTLELKMTDPATKTVIHFANTGYETSDTIPVGTFTLS